MSTIINLWKGGYRMQFTKFNILVMQEEKFFCIKCYKCI